MKKRWYHFFTPKLRNTKPPDSSRKPSGSRAAPSQHDTNDGHHSPDAPLPNALEISGKRYQIQHFAEGGICEILLGTPDMPGDDKIAIKLIKPEWLNHQGVRRQFSTESQIVRSLNTSQLPRYVSRGIWRGRAFFAYKFIDGFPLIQVSQRQDLFPPNMVRTRSLDIIHQLLKQLHYLNTKLNPVAHGDISSENIIIDDDLKIHVVDFGCAHFTNLVSKESYQWIAKPSFLSPEQARGESWGHQSDLYQAGILFFELLAAQRWNRGKTSREKLLFAAADQLPQTDIIDEIAGKDVRVFLDRLLAPSRNQRFQSAKEALTQLELL